MKISKQFVAAAALLASVGSVASAQTFGSLGGGGGVAPTATTLGAPCAPPNACAVPGIGTISGGTVYATDMTQADDVFSGVRFLASGTSSTQPATLTFTGLFSYLSFAWGSPDPENRLIFTTSNGTMTTFTAAGLGLPTSGDQSLAQYVQFTAAPGQTFTSVQFTNVPTRDAFEVTNFTASVVPEPSTYALMGAGLLALGFVSRRRNRA